MGKQITGTRLFIVGLLAMLSLVQCRKERFITDASAALNFSTDTVQFDTVFTTIGSTTEVVKVYNPHDEAIKISHIDLENGTGSQYRLAVDGVNGASFDDIEIPAGDSLWVLVEVTVDPSNINTPFVVEDRIRFETNGNEQFVYLVAWGQDAYFHGGVGSGNIDEIISTNTTWFNDKPHVIYGLVAVDSCVTLTITEGTQVYVHAGSGLYIYKGALVVNGSFGNEVVFQGDRLEPEYDDIPGQWGIELDFEVSTGLGPDIASIVRGGIWFYEAKPSTINYAILKNGTIGIQADTSGATGNDYCLTVSNTRVLNMSAIGIWAQGSEIQGWNNLVANCGQACGAFTIGGRYDFTHTTFANYWQEGARTAPSFVLNNYYEDINQNLQVRTLEQADFKNCIMWGSNAGLNDFSEFVVDLEEEDVQSYFFQSCIVDTDEDVSAAAHFLDMKTTAPQFINPGQVDFHPAGFPGNMVGLSSFQFFDLDNQPYTNGVNIGCFTNPL
jgi:hypothetical protein